jgi:hypothetical protein
VLERVAGQPNRTPFVRTHAAGLVAAFAGLASLIAAAFMQFSGARPITRPPDVWVTVPLLALAVLAAGFAFHRREPYRAFAIAGVGMASAAVALGWVLVAAAVGAGAVLICIVLAKLL